MTVTIDRDTFFKIMKKSPNLDYVMEIEGFAKSKAPVSLFEIMKRLDVLDITCFLFAAGKDAEALTVAEFYIADLGDMYCCWDGFDCYMPFDKKRDYVIKQILKGVIPEHPYGPNFVHGEKGKDYLSGKIKNEFNYRMAA